MYLREWSHDSHVIVYPPTHNIVDDSEQCHRQKRVTCIHDNSMDGWDRETKNARTTSIQRTLVPSTVHFEPLRRGQPLQRDKKPCLSLSELLHVATVLLYLCPKSEP